VSRVLLRVYCPRGHRLVKLVAVPDAGVAVLVATRHGTRVMRWDHLADPDTVLVDDASRLRITDAVPVNCRCKPDWIPARWLHERVRSGASSAVWPQSSDIVNDT
jgi:hypothetical protein